METKTVTHEVFLNATAHEVFEAYIDEEQHAEFTGAPAKIERKAGGRLAIISAERRKRSTKTGESSSRGAP